MDGQRRALIIASDEYDNPGLSRLRAPAADAEALANVLGDKELGGFHVKVVHNKPAYIVGGHIEDLFAESQSEDLVLLHFSGHGLKSDSASCSSRLATPARTGSGPRLSRPIRPEVHAQLAGTQHRAVPGLLLRRGFR